MRQNRWTSSGFITSAVWQAGLHQRVLFSLTAKIRKFRQGSKNPVNALMSSGHALPCLRKDLRKNPLYPYHADNVQLLRHGQRHNDWLIDLRIRLITKYRPAQRQYPACLTWLMANCAVRWPLTNSRYPLVLNFFSITSFNAALQGSGPETSVSTGGFHLRGPSSFLISELYTELPFQL